jgi:ionotropic glutamate receptor
MCYSEEMINAFISALDAAVQDEFDVAAQVSDEEWEAIRPTKIQRRDMLLKHMQVIQGLQIPFLRDTVIN